MPALFQKILKTRIVTERLGPDEAEFIQLVRQMDEKSERLLGRALALPPAEADRTTGRSAVLTP